MTSFLFYVFRATPVWVWAILAALVGLGIRQMRARSVKPSTLFIAPAVFFVIGLLSSGRAGAAIVGWALAVILLALITATQWRSKSIRYDAESGLLHAPGSVVPLFFMLSTFLVSYVTRVMFAIDPGKAGSIVWQVGVATLIGSLTGIFLGRAISIFWPSRAHSIGRVSLGSTRSIQ